MAKSERVTPMTDVEIEEYRHASDKDTWHPHSLVQRLIATIDALKAQISSYCAELCTLHDKHNYFLELHRNEMQRQLEKNDALEAERDQVRREALEEAAKAMCPFCNGKHEWLAANPINEGYGWRHKYQRIGRESSHFVNCRAWAIRTLELSTIRPMKTIRALAAKEKP